MGSAPYDFTRVTLCRVVNCRLVTCSRLRVRVRVYMCVLRMQQSKNIQMR